MMVTMGKLRLRKADLLRVPGWLVGLTPAVGGRRPLRSFLSEETALDSPLCTPRSWLCPWVASLAEGRVTAVPWAVVPWSPQRDEWGMGSHPPPGPGGGHPSCPWTVLRVQSPAAS